MPRDRAWAWLGAQRGPSLLVPLQGHFHRGRAAPGPPVRTHRAPQPRAWACSLRARRSRRHRRCPSSRRSFPEPAPAPIYRARPRPARPADSPRDGCEPGPAPPPSARAPLRPRSARRAPPLRPNAASAADSAPASASLGVGPLPREEGLRALWAACPTDGGQKRRGDEGGPKGFHPARRNSPGAAAARKQPFKSGWIPSWRRG